MKVVAKLAVLAVVFAVSGEALFAPKCLWSGLLGSSEESGERWLRDTTSLRTLRTRDSRVRRFLWTDKDVCDWMCRDDYGSEVRDICRRCCPGSAAASPTQRPPRPQTAATATASDLQSRATRSTAALETAQSTTASATAPASSAAPASTPAPASSASPAPSPAPASSPAPAGK